MYRAMVSQLKDQSFSTVHECSQVAERQSDRLSGRGHEVRDSLVEISVELTLYSVSVCTVVVPLVESLLVLRRARNIACKLITAEQDW